MTYLHLVSRAISAAFFAITLVAILLQVISRYLFQWPLGWTSEIALNAFLVGSWWTICMNVPLKDHVRIALVFNLLPPWAQEVARIFSGVFGGAMLFLALPGNLKYLEVVNRLETGVLKMPISWIYAVFTIFLVVVGGRLLVSSALSVRLLFKGAAK